MTTKEIANRLAALCREGRFEAAQKELFAPDAVSIEQEDSPAFARETKGLAAIYEKGRQFMGMVEQVHAMEVSEPIVAGDSFACFMRMDMTMKGRGRMDMKEICVYETKDGKVTSERFFS